MLIADAPRADLRRSSVRHNAVEVAISLVIPVRDEAARVATELERIAAWLEKAGTSAEVIVVDDDSFDGTRATVEAFSRRIRGLVLLRHLESRGVVDALRTGLLAARGRTIVFGGLSAIAGGLDRLSELISAVQRGLDCVHAVIRRSPTDSTAGTPAGSWLSSLVSAIRGRSSSIPGGSVVACSREASHRILPKTGAGTPGPADWTALARQAGYRLVRMDDVPPGENRGPDLDQRQRPPVERA
jgi:hypothetical protein